MTSALAAGTEYHEAFQNVKAKVQQVAALRPYVQGEHIMRINLRNARKAAGLTQQAIADKLGINIRYYKTIESGEKLGGIWMWDKLEDLLNVHQRVLRENHPDKEDSP